jgi:CBS domain-containing protein
MFSLDSPMDWGPDLSSAIDRSPLTVPPHTPLLEAIALLSQTHRANQDPSSSPTESGSNRVSCLLVMTGQQLQGIVTERDIVRLTAKNLDFATATVADIMVHPVITMTHGSLQDIFAALFLFRRYRIRHLPIVDASGHLEGVISHSGLRQILRPANLLRFRRVADVMATEVVRASLTHNVFYLTRLMAEQRVSCVVITEENEEGIDRPVGIVTERDIVKFQSMQVDLQQTLARDVMSTPLFLLTPEDSLWTANQEMKTRQVGRLVVSWNWGQGLGIVTQTSLLKVFDPMEMYGVIENLQQTIQELEAERLALRQAETLASPLAEQGELPTFQIAHTLLDRASQNIQTMLDNAKSAPDHELLKSTLLAITKIQQLLQHSTKTENPDRST